MEKTRKEKKKEKKEENFSELFPYKTLKKIFKTFFTSKSYNETTHNFWVPDRSDFLDFNFDPFL